MLGEGRVETEERERNEWEEEREMEGGRSEREGGWENSINTRSSPSEAAVLLSSPSGLDR